jgi:hypothetical protein
LHKAFRCYWFGLFQFGVMVPSLVTKNIGLLDFIVD